MIDEKYSSCGLSSIGTALPSALAYSMERKELLQHGDCIVQRPI
jgi:hypothetical protein